MSTYYDEPTDSSGPLGNPRVVTAIVLGVAGLVAVIGCVGLYLFVGGGSGQPGQGTVVVNVTSLPSLTPSLTPIPTETPAPTEEGVGGGGEAATPDFTQTFAALPAIRTANLTELRGLVQIRTDPQGSFVTVTENIAIPEGTTVLTSENSSAKITTTEGTIIRVSSQTQFTLTDLSGNPANPVTRLTLDFGKLWNIVGGPLGTGSYSVDTPLGTASVIGSWMGTEHNSTEQIDIITCLEGKCRYSNDQGVQEFQTEQQLIVEGDAPLPDPTKMDVAQFADWSPTKVPEVITLTATPTTTGTPTVTRTPTNTRTPANTQPPSNTPNAAATGNAAATNTAAALTNTAVAGSNSLTQAANSQNQTATQNSAHLTATIFFFNATSTAFFNSTQNSFTATSFAFTSTAFAATSNANATNFVATSNAAATGSVLTATQLSVNQTNSAGTATAASVFATATANAANATGTATALTATQAAKPIVNFDPASYATAAPESAGSVTLTVRIANPRPVNVNLVASLVGSGPSTPATGGSNLPTSPVTCGSHVDFDSDNIFFFIPANQLTTTINVPISDDGCSETNESFQVNLACTVAGCNGAELGSNVTSTVTIVESGRPSVGFSSGSPSVNEGDADSTANIVVTLSRPYANVNTVTVNYGQLAGGTATGAGACGYPTDYDTDFTDDDGGSPFTLNFPPGITSRTINIPICGDNVSEGNETVFLSLSGQSSNVNLGTASATMTIVDNDPLPTLTVALITATSATEPGDATGSLTATFRVSLSTTPGRDVTVQYATGGGTAAGNVDYIVKSGTVTFLKDTGTLTQDIDVTIKGDALDEESETFNFTLSSPSNATLGTPSSATQTILDDAGDGPVNVSFSNTPNSVSESGGGSDALDCNNNASPAGQVHIKVNLDLPSGKTVFVNFATSDGTANVPGDYFTTAGTLQFNPGEQCKSFLITIVNDQVAESTESINLTLSGAVNANISLPNPRSLFINDND